MIHCMVDTGLIRVHDAAKVKTHLGFQPDPFNQQLLHNPQHSRIVQRHHS
jgi:hypothetical protein